MPLAILLNVSRNIIASHIQVQLRAIHFEEIRELVIPLQVSVSISSC